MKKLFQPPSTAQYIDADRIGHFYAVDLLRGVAAIVTLIWHYQHFYMAKALTYGKPVPGVDRAVQPLYSILWPIYEHGFWAVQAFWIISGFVFAHVYAGRKTSWRDFAVARFARLYPLHFITLVTVAVLQTVSVALFGGSQVVSVNDTYHFMLQTLFISHWGFQSAISFNAPFWSVSVELAIYGLFFVMAKRVFNFGILIPALGVFIGYAIMNRGTPLWFFAMCGHFFFIGTLCYFVTLKMSERSIVAISAAMVAIFAQLAASGRLATMPFHNAEAFLFVPIILGAAFIDKQRVCREWLVLARWLGDSTYSLYLWHFPVQVLILILLMWSGLDRSFLNNPAFLIAWVAGMAALSLVSFRLIERPAQNWIRASSRQFEQPERPLAPSPSQTAPHISQSRPQAEPRATPAE